MTSSSGLRGHRRTYLTILESTDHALLKMVRHVLLRPLRPELDVIQNNCRVRFVGISRYVHFRNYSTINEGQPPYCSNEAILAALRPAAAAASMHPSMFLLLKILAQGPGSVYYFPMVGLIFVLCVQDATTKIGSIYTLSTELNCKEINHFSGMPRIKSFFSPADLLVVWILECPFFSNYFFSKNSIKIPNFSKKNR
jgi:hypothetical protein